MARAWDASGNPIEDDAPRAWDAQGRPIRAEIVTPAPEEDFFTRMRRLHAMPDEERRALMLTSAEADARRGENPIAWFFTPTQDKPMSPAVAALMGAFDTDSFGLFDEAHGLRAALGGADRAQARDEMRRALDVALEDRPISTMGGSIAGPLPMGGALMQAYKVLPGGAALHQAAGGRGLGAAAAQGGLGAYTGAAFGGLYGLGAGDSDLAGNIDSALDYAKAGGAFGGGGALAFNALGPAWRNPYLRSAGGAGLGGVLGYAVTPEGEDPLASAALGAGLGGGAAYGAPRAMRAASEGAGEFWRRLAQARFAHPSGRAPAQLGMSIGAPIPPGGTAPPAASGARPPHVPESVVSDIDRVLGRRGWEAEDLSGAVGAARARASGPERQRMDTRLTDLLEDEGQAKTRALVQSVGTTRQSARRIAEARARALPSQIADDAQRMLGVRMSPQEQLREIARQGEATSPLYQAAFQHTPSRAAWRERVNPLLREPMIQRAMAKAHEFLQSAARREARESGGAQVRAVSIQQDPNGVWRFTRPDPRALHLVKVGVDEVIAVAKRAADSGGLGPFGLRDARLLKQELLDAIEGNPAQGRDALIPGYREARNQAAGLHEAEEAIDLGKAAINARPQAVRAEMAQMTEAEKYHYRIGLADAAIQKVMRAGRAVGQQNAANALNSVEIQNVFREAFDSPQQAESFLRVLNERNELMRNAATWGGGSSSIANAAQLGDQVTAQMADSLATAATGAPIAAVRAGGGAFWNALKSGVLERRNNDLGRAMLSSVEDVGPEGDAAFVDALLNALVKRHTARVNAANLAGAQAPVALQGGRLYEHDPYGGF